jgi:Phosphoribosylglycinamide synthetase, N domain
LALQEAPYRTFLNATSTTTPGKDITLYCLPTSTTEYVQHADESALVRTKLLHDETVAIYSVEANAFVGGPDILASAPHPAFMALTQLELQVSQQVIDPATKRQDVVIVVGSGGREHALAVAVAKSPLVAKVICCPGNGGTAVEGGKISNAEGVNGKQDNATVIALVKKEKAQMVVVGPEAPLVDGLVDELKVVCPDVMAFGPTKAAAELEASKVSSLV